MSNGQHRNLQDMLTVSNDKFAITKLCPTPFGTPSDANGFHFNGFDWSISGYIQRELVCIDSNMCDDYVMFMLLADKSSDTLVSAYLKDI